MASAAIEQLLVEAADHYNGGRPRLARALCADVLAAAPEHLTALHLAAVIAFADGRSADGRDLLGRLFQRDPNHVPALTTLGDALAVQNEHEAAHAVFARAIALRPREASLHIRRGVALSELGRAAEAEAAYRCALELAPDLIQARFNLATALAAQQRCAEAEQVYREVIARDPAHPGALINLGHLLAADDRPDEAIMAYRQALQPDTSRATAAETAAALTGLAARLRARGAFEEAEAACERALSAKPDDAPAQTNLGIIRDAQGRYAEAVTCHRRAIAADPTCARAHANLAVALRVIGALDEARAAAERAVALDPDDPEIRFNHAHVLLLNGELARGFEELRWGRHCKGWADGYPALAQPEWNGEPLQGRTLLLYAEAGLGDALQFVRYLPLLRDRGGGIVLQVQPALVPLLRANTDVAVIARGEALPPFDLHLPLIGLPRLFGTTLDSIPAGVPYLRPDATRLAKWRQALSDDTQLRVGVVWAGNPGHKGDRQRSLSAAQLLPHLAQPGVRLYSLQKEPRPADLPAIAALGTGLIDLAPHLQDFADTAAAVACLDLVISVDTSVAHLAGALGRPLWLMLPHALDWRWLRDRADSPWYPSLRLFRQQRALVWDDVIARIAAELGWLARQPGSRHRRPDAPHSA